MMTTNTILRNASDGGDCTGSSIHGVQNYQLSQHMTKQCVSTLDSPSESLSFGSVSASSFLKNLKSTPVHTMEEEEKIVVWGIDGFTVQSLIQHLFRGISCELRKEVWKTRIVNYKGCLRAEVLCTSNKVRNELITEFRNKDLSVRVCPGRSYLERQRRQQIPSKHNPKTFTKSRIRVGSWNVRSLPSKVLEVVDCLHQRDVDVLLVQEANMDNSILKLNGYSYLAGSRENDRTRLGFLVSDQLINFFTLLDPKSNFCNWCSIRITGESRSRLDSPNNTVYICNVYLPCEWTTEKVERELLRLEGQIKTYSVRGRIYVAGDFNARIGDGSRPGNEKVIGLSSEGKVNKRGIVVRDFLLRNNLTTLNGYNKQGEIGYTFFRNGLGISTIDYFVMETSRFNPSRNVLTIAKDMDICSDHALLYTDLRLERIAPKAAHKTLSDPDKDGSDSAIKSLRFNTEKLMEKGNVLRKRFLSQMKETFMKWTLDFASPHINVDQSSLRIQTTIQEVAKKTIGVKSQSPSSSKLPAWWNSQVKKDIATRRNIYKQLLKTPPEECEVRDKLWESYKTQRKKVVATIRDAKSTQQQKEVESLLEIQSSGQSKKLWQHINRITSRKNYSGSLNLGPMMLEGSLVQPTDRSYAEAWANYFKCLANDVYADETCSETMKQFHQDINRWVSEWDYRLIQPHLIWSKMVQCPKPDEFMWLDRNNDNTLKRPFELRELIRAIRGMEDHKSPHLDGIAPELFKVLKCSSKEQSEKSRSEIYNFFRINEENSSAFSNHSLKEYLEIAKEYRLRAIHPLLLELFNKCWKQEKIPETWRSSLTVPIPKAGDKTQFNNYRGISISPVMLKLYTALIKNRLSDLFEAQNLLMNEQAGFRPHRECMDQIYSLDEVLTRVRARRHNPNFYLAFLDFKKAYDKVWRTGLWYKLIVQFGIRDKTLRVLQDIYKGNKARVKVNGKFSPEFESSIGLRQGCILSPLLFDVYINDLVKKINKSNLGITIEDEKGISKSISCLLYADDIVVITDDSTKLQKMLDLVTEWCHMWQMEVNHSKCGMMTNNNGDQPKFTLTCKEIPQVSEYKYLGVIFTPDGTWDKEIKQRIEKTKAVEVAITNALTDRKLLVKTRRDLVEATIDPVALYGTEIVAWNAQQTSKFESIKVNALRKIIRARKKTPSEAIRGDLGIVPLKLKAMQRKVRYANKLTLDAAKNPLTKFLWKLGGKGTGRTGRICLKTRIKQTLRRLKVPLKTLKIRDKKELDDIVKNAVEETAWNEHKKKREKSILLKKSGYNVSKLDFGYEKYLDSTFKKGETFQRMYVKEEGKEKGEMVIVKSMANEKIWARKLGADLKFRIRSGTVTTESYLYNIGARNSDKCRICGVKDTTAHAIIQCKGLDEGELKRMLRQTGVSPILWNRLNEEEKLNHLTGQMIGSQGGSLMAINYYLGCVAKRLYDRLGTLGVKANNGMILKCNYKDK